MSLLGFFVYISTAFAAVMAVLIAVTSHPMVEGMHPGLRLHPMNDRVAATSAPASPANAADKTASAAHGAAVKADSSKVDAKKAEQQRERRRLAAWRKLNAAKRQRADSTALGFAEENGQPANGAFAARPAGRLFDQW